MPNGCPDEKHWHYRAAPHNKELPELKGYVLDENSSPDYDMEAQLHKIPGLELDELYSVQTLSCDLVEEQLPFLV